MNPQASLTREEAADLLRRYPDVSQDETKLIITFLRKGRHLDVGMLTADEDLKPYVEAFMADHKKELRVGFVEGTAVVAAIAAFFAMCWLLWEAVKPASLAV
ncbi:MAG TPA: hypothetical protein VHE36_10375 [Sphingomicrobium sp.]|nr:hypothetical protein [Sphingomicrobium sp.]